MISKSSALSDIITHIWNLFDKGVNEKKNDFHFPVLGTSGPEGIQQRMVVLRHVVRESCLIYILSDYRTGKVADILENSRINWLFYNHKTKEQVRASGEAQIHHMDDIARTWWDQIPPSERGDYLGTLSPGAVTQEHYPNLPAFYRNKKADYQNTEYGFNNFCIVSCSIDSLEYLQLRRDGHIRAKFLYRDSQWKGMWIAP